MTRSATPDKPAWGDLVERNENEWCWRDGRLVHRLARQPDAGRRRLESRLQSWVVSNLYSRQSKTKDGRAAVRRVLDELAPEDWGVCVGAGATRHGDRVINVDVDDVSVSGSSNIDVLTYGELLPFRDEVLGVAISQEVLEHVPSPQTTVAEVLRVLKPGGLFYCQLPFIVGYHPGPTDYWRFTREGIQELFHDVRWQVEQVGLTLGPGSALYRVAVEFCAINASVVHRKLYRPVKAISAVALWPITWTDAWTSRSPQKDRINGGYFCVARKVGTLD